MLISLPIYLCTKLLQRYEIVNGVVEAEGVADEAKTEEEEEDKAAEGTFIVVPENSIWWNSFVAWYWSNVFMQRKECLSSGWLQWKIMRC